MKKKNNGPGRDLLRTLEDMLHLPAPTDKHAAGIHRLILMGTSSPSYVLQVGGAAIVAEVIMIRDCYD